jgi:hypothetical protein
MAKRKRTNNDLQNITHTTKDRVTRTPLKTGMNSGAPEGNLFDHYYIHYRLLITAGKICRVGKRRKISTL